VLAVCSDLGKHGVMTATLADPGTLARLLDPAGRADPYPLYAEVREAGSVQFVPNLPTALVSTYDDCLALLRDPRVSNDRRKSDIVGRIQTTSISPLTGQPSFLFLDPPDHTRLRRLVSAAFTARAVQRLEPFVRRTVDDLLDAAAARGGLDVLADLAYPLPVTVICRLLGIPIEDEPQFRAWSTLLSRSLDPTVALYGAPAAGQAERVAAAEQSYEYFGRLLASRRRDPGDDLLSALIATGRAGDTLTEDEIIRTCVLMLIAGHETTVGLISNGALALLRHPAEFAALRADLSRVGAVVEETLRYDPPVQVNVRVITADIALGGSLLERGMIAILLLAGAQRDPAANPDPDRFDPGRAEIRHLAFGYGIHFCLGAPLARLEARCAYTRLAQRMREPRLAADPPPYRDHFTLRRVAALPVHHAGIAPRTVAW
jgi:cytochrome P450